MTRSVRFNPHEYTACVRELSEKEASDIAQAHRNMASWRHKPELNYAVAAWWQSVADTIAKEVRACGLLQSPSGAGK